MMNLRLLSLRTRLRQRARLLAALPFVLLPFASPADVLHTLDSDPLNGTITFEAGGDAITITDAQGQSRSVNLLNIERIELGNETNEPVVVADGNLLLVHNDHATSNQRVTESIELRAGLHRIVIPYWQGEGAYELAATVTGPGVDGTVSLGATNLRSFLNSNQETDSSPGIDAEGYRLPEMSLDEMGDHQMIRRARYELLVSDNPGQMRLASMTTRRQGTTSTISTQIVTDPDVGFGLVFNAYFIAEFDGEYTFSLRSNDGSQLYFGDVDEFVVRVAADETAIESPWRAELRNRGIARGEVVGIADQVLTMSLPLVAETGLETRIGLSHIVALWSQTVDPQALNRGNETPGQDTLYFLDRDNANQVLSFPGRIIAFDDAQVQFFYNGQVRQINRDRVVGMVFDHSDRPDPPATGFHQTLRYNSSGQVLPCRIESIGDELVVQLVGGERMTMPRAGLTTIGFENGLRADLTQIEPTAEEAIPYFGLRMPHRVGTNFSGGAVRLADDNAYERSLAVHSLSRLHYRLDRPCERLRASFGLMVPGGNQGNVTARVRGDGEVLWEQADITIDSGVIEIDVPLAGVERLVLEVDFGEGQGVGDRAAWCNPTLIYDAQPEGDNP